MGPPGRRQRRERPAAAEAPPVEDVWKVSNATPAALSAERAYARHGKRDRAFRRTCRSDRLACNRYSLTFASEGRECQVVVDEADGRRAIADGRGHAFHRAVPDVAGGEHARGGGLQQEGSPLQGPVLTGVGSGQDESPWVALDRLGEPVGERLRADEDEQAGGWYQFGLAGVAVSEQQLLKMAAALAARDL